MRSIQRWRWLAVFLQTALVAGLPFVYVDGRSALRFDIPTMRLYLFGMRLWVGEFYVVLLAALIFFMLIIAFTLVLGRVWCGWACPQTAIGEYVGWLRGFFRSRKSDGLPARFLKMLGYHLSLGFLCGFVSANLIWYFVSPYEMLPELFTWSLGLVTKSFFVVMAVALFAHFEFLGQRFCGTVCPYSKWQSVLLDKNSMIIAFDKERADECMGCERCVTVCPTGIDIKAGLQVECINCAKCVDVCREMTARRGKAPIVRYVFGGPGGSLRDALTPRFWAFAAAAAVLVAMLAYHMASRESFALQVVKDSGSLYSMAEGGYVVNSYEAYITNRSERDAEYKLLVTGVPGAALSTGGMPVHAPSGERITLPFEVRAPAAGMHGAARIKVTVRDESSGETAEADAGFIFP